MMKAIANPSSVVCTGLPSAKPARAKPEGLRGAGTSPYIRGSVAKSQRLLRAEVNAPDLPTGGELRQAAQHESRPPFGVLDVVDPQIRQAAQQRGNGDLGFDPRQLGPQAEMNAAAERQRPDVLPG